MPLKFWPSRRYPHKALVQPWKHFTDIQSTFYVKIPPKLDLELDKSYRKYQYI